MKFKILKIVYGYKVKNGKLVNGVYLFIIYVCLITSLNIEHQQRENGKIQFDIVWRSKHSKVMYFVFVNRFYCRQMDCLNFKRILQMFGKNQEMYLFIWFIQKEVYLNYVLICKYQYNSISMLLIPSAHLECYSSKNVRKKTRQKDGPLVLCKI